MKAYLMDQFGEMSLVDIPVLLISMIIAAAMVYLLGFALPVEKRKEALRTGALLAALTCLGASVGRNSLPVAVLISGAFVMGIPLLSNGKEGPYSRLFVVSALVLGVVCGVKSTIIAAIAFLPLFLLLYLTSRKDS